MSFLGNMDYIDIIWLLLMYGVPYLVLLYLVLGLFETKDNIIWRFASKIRKKVYFVFIYIKDFLFPYWNYIYSFFSPHWKLEIWTTKNTDEIVNILGEVFSKESVETKDNENNKFIVEPANYEVFTSKKMVPPLVKEWNILDKGKFRMIEIKFRPPVSFKYYFTFHASLITLIFSLTVYSITDIKDFFLSLFVFLIFWLAYFFVVSEIYNKYENEKNSLLNSLQTNKFREYRI